MLIDVIVVSNIITIGRSIETFEKYVKMGKI